MGAGTFARVPSEGLALAVVLAERDVAFAGLLIGAATFPQMITGPIGGPLLDRSQRPGRLLAAAALATAVAFALLAADQKVVQLLAAVAISATAPMLTGGLSAAFTTWAGAGSTHEVSAWDGVAYNVAGVIAPIAVTAIAVAVSPNWALIALAFGGVCAAAFVIAAPGRDPDRIDENADDGIAITRALQTMWRERGLRAVTVATTIDHVGVGALTIALASAALDHGRPATAAGVVASVRAISALTGSLVLTRFGARANPVTMVLASVGFTGACTIAMGWSSWPVLIALGFVIGMGDGPILVGTYRARSDGSAEGSRASVFTVGASLKLAASSVGAVVAGALLADQTSSLGLVAVGAIGMIAAGSGWWSWAGFSSERRAPLRANR